MTQALTESESLGITLEAVECLLIQPALMSQELDTQLADLSVRDISFAEPSQQDEDSVRRSALGIPRERRGHLSALLDRVRSDLLNDK